MVTGETQPATGPDSQSAPDPAQADSTRAELDGLVTDLLGRRPQGRYEVAVHGADGTPVVLVNEPFLDSGRPMPTRYWLIDPALNKAIGTLESIGGVKTAEAVVDGAELRASHDRYRRERELHIHADHNGPKPSGGVGGTRTGVKCLHAHYAYYLAGGDDPVGRWVDQQLQQSGDTLPNLIVAHRAASDDELELAATTGDGGGSDKPVGDITLIELGSGALKLLRRSDQGDLRRRYPTNMLAAIDDSGRLSDNGRDELHAALSRAKDELGDAAVVRVVATEALRQRPSGDVAAMVQDILGCNVEVLDGRRETELAYRAVVGSGPGVDATGTIETVVLDIGYGSTEIAGIGPDGQLHAISLSVGAKTITDAYLHGDPPRADELSAALSVIELHLDDVRREEPVLAQLLAGEASEVVGLGAVRHIAEVELGRNDGDEIDGYRLEHRHVEEVFRALATEAARDRAANPGLHAHHVPLIVGWLCILVETMRQFGIEDLRTSTAGLLDGLLAEIVESEPSVDAEVGQPESRTIES